MTLVKRKQGFAIVVLDLPEALMNRRQSCSCCSLPVIIILATCTTTAHAAGDSADIMCDQLGREIALRAAEQLGAAIDTSTRSTLADIAGQACLDYQSMPPAGAETARPAPAADDRVDEPGEAGLFDVEIIDPQDRVKRPGLKRR
jgi:hypothetical protein